MPALIASGSSNHQEPRPGEDLAAGQQTLHPSHQVPCRYSESDDARAPRTRLVSLPLESHKRRPKFLAAGRRIWARCGRRSRPALRIVSMLLKWRMWP
jgi:hypothetical protein